MSEDTLERMLRAIETIAANDALYLDDVGWFQILRFDAYEGVNPRTGERVFVRAKTLVKFEPDGNLLNAVNRRPREDLGDPTQSNRDNVIHRYEWTKPIAREATADLLASGSAEIAGFGILRVEQRVIEHDDPPRRAVGNWVFFELAESLRQRLDAIADAR